MNSISFKMKYKDTDFERQYEIENVSDEDILIETVRSKVVAINESLAGGQASTLANLFVSDDYDSQEQIGTLENIYNVKIKVIEETDIPNTSPTTTRKIAFNPEDQTENNPEEFPSEDVPKEDDQR